MTISNNNIPLEFEPPAACSPSLPSVVRALESLAPKIMCPSHVPARPPAMPAKSGFRWNHEVCCAAGAGLDAGEGVPAIEGGGAVDGLAVVDCSIGLAPLS
jgi:hypothetical protein